MNKNIKKYLVYFIKSFILAFVLSEFIIWYDIIAIIFWLILFILQVLDKVKIQKYIVYGALVAFMTVFIYKFTTTFISILDVAIQLTYEDTWILTWHMDYIKLIFSWDSNENGLIYVFPVFILLSILYIIFIYLFYKSIKNIKKH